MSITEKLVIDLKYLTDKIEALGVEYSSELNRHKKELENIKITYSMKKKQAQDSSNAAITKYKDSLSKYEKTIYEQKHKIRDVENKLSKRFAKIDVDVSALAPEKFDEKEAEELLRMINETGFIAWLKKLLSIGKYDSNKNMACNLYSQIANAYMYLDNKLIKEKSRYLSIIQKEKDNLITKCNFIDREYKSRLNSEDAVFLSKTRSLQQKKQILISDRKISDIDKALTTAFCDLGCDNSGWIKYTPSQSLPSDLLVGTIAVPSGISSPNEIQNEVLKKIPSYNIKLNCFVIPFSVSTGKPFLIYSETDQSNVHYQAEIFNSFVLRQLRFMPKNSIKISYIDPVNRGTAMGQLSHLYGETACNVCYPYLDNQDIAKEIKDIKGHVDKVCSTLTKAGCSSIYSYNASQKQGRIPYRTIIINDFPAGFDSQSLDDLKVIIDKSEQCGISILISRKKQDVLENKALDLIKKTEKQFIQHSINSGRSDTITLSTTYGFKKFSNTVSDSFLMEINTFYNYKPPIVNNFEKFFDAKKLPAYRSAVKELNIPFAVDRKGNVVEFTLTHKALPYAFITGTIGSGKTTFLHTLITSAVLHYHPDDLEIWLADFKETEFAFYTKCCPHHIRYIAANESEEIAYSVIDEILLEIRRRKDIFKAVDAKGGFVDYRKKYNDMPRLLIIVDEFHRMSEAAVERDGYKVNLENIALEARSHGISLIFCDQDTTGLKGFTDKAAKRFSVRLALRNEEASDVRESLKIDPMNLSEELKIKINELTRSMDGNFIYKKEDADAGGINKVEFLFGRALFISDSQMQGDYINSANNRIGSYNRDKVFFIDAKPEPMKNSVLADFEKKYPVTADEGERYYIGSALGLRTSFYFNLKKLEANENILMVGADNQKRLAMIKSMVNCALHNNRQVVFLIAKTSLLYSQNKAFFKEGTGVTIYDTFPEICKFIGENSNQINRLVDEEEVKIFDDSKFVICIGLSDIFDKMENSRLTQEQAWKTVEVSEETTVSTTVYETKLVEASVVQRKKEKSTNDEPSNGDSNGTNAFYANILSNINAAKKEADTYVSKTETIQEKFSGSSGTAISGYKATKDLHTLLSDGWKINMNMLVVLDKSSEYKKMKRQLNFEEVFNHIIALRMSSNASGEFMSKNRVMQEINNKDDKVSAVYSYNGSTERLFRPYIL